MATTCRRTWGAITPPSRSSPQATRLTDEPGNAAQRMAGQGVGLDVVNELGPPELVGAPVNAVVQAYDFRKAVITMGLVDKTSIG
jgi:hypothetical protein